MSEGTVSEGTVGEGTVSEGTVSEGTVSESTVSELIAAVKAGDAARLAALLDGGAAVDGSDEQGWTALSWAAGRGNAGVVALLLERGADVFHRGRDLRTPFLIALAAGRREVALRLREAEKALDSDRRGLYPGRPYCRAYPLAELRRFPGWQEPPPEEPADSGEPDADLEQDAERRAEEAVLAEIAFVHQDLTVTRSAWHGEQVLFASTDGAWREFCATTLGFRVPDDLDLVPEGGPGR